MKKTIVIAGVCLLFIHPLANAQENNKWDPKKNPTVDSITSNYSLLEMPKPLTAEKAFPVIGQYQLTNNTDQTNIGTVTITLDDQNKGVVWIEGLPYGKIMGQLRRSPATYKIPAQTSPEGKEVPEGTLVYDKDTRMLNICIGKPYNMQHPDQAFVMEETKTEETPATTAKTKKKPVSAVVQKAVIYSGPKEEQTTVMMNQ